MAYDIEKAQIMFKLARKGNWGNKYDRTEHFRRFQKLHEAIKELQKSQWLILHKKPKYLGISLNPKNKKEIINFIETKMPYLKGYIK